MPGTLGPGALNAVARERVRRHSALAFTTLVPLAWSMIVTFLSFATTSSVGCAPMKLNLPCIE